MWSYNCFRCGNEIIFRRRLEDDEIIPIHVDGSCKPSGVRYVPVVHASVVAFAKDLAGKELVGAVLNVTECRVRIARVGESVAPVRGAFRCDVRVAEDLVVLVYLGTASRPERESVIRFWPQEVVVREAFAPDEIAIRRETGSGQGALYSEHFEVVGHVNKAAGHNNALKLTRSLAPPPRGLGGGGCACPPFGGHRALAA